MDGFLTFVLAAIFSDCKVEMRNRNLNFKDPWISRQPLRARLVNIYVESDFSSLSLLLLAFLYFSRRFGQSLPIRRDDYL